MIEDSQYLHKSPEMRQHSSKDDPLVSIVIPAFNHAKYLNQAIDSVLGQDYKNIELIVLDDGSTDNTVEVLGKYDGLFHWETQPNMGQASTLNKGWQLSKGEILGYLSADDSLLPNAVSKSVAWLAKNSDAVLTYGDFNLIDPNSAIIRRVIAPEMSYKETIVRLVCVPGPGAFFRRSAFISAGLWNPALKQMPDYDYWLRLGVYGKFIHISEVLANFRVHGASQSFARPSIDNANEPVLIISRFFNSNLPHDLLKLRDMALASAELVSAQLHFRAKRYLNGFACLKRSFFLAPTGLISVRTWRILFNALLNRMGHTILWQAKKVLASLKDFLSMQ